jgi:hypothetical protein
MKETHTLCIVVHACTCWRKLNLQLKDPRLYRKYLQRMEVCYFTDMTHEPFSNSVLQNDVVYHRIYEYTIVDLLQIVLEITLLYNLKPLSRAYLY